MPDKVFAQDPVEITLADGIPRQLRFTNGSTKRLRQKFKLTSFSELFNIEFGDLVAPMIFEGLVEKSDLTEEAIDDLIPLPRMKEIQATILAALSGKTVDEVTEAIKNVPSSQPQPEAEVKTPVM